MSLLSLMSEDVQILHREVSGEDSSGVETVDFTAGATVRTFVAHVATTENVGGRDLVVADWRFMLPAGTAVEAYDRLVHDGRTFEVVGLPIPVIRPGSGEEYRVANARFMEG